ncbi:hypothetical protein BAQ46_04335 [Bacillus paranthracis]|uniref:hypothetical protein n=1 Tax=Bacillus paranthracis TaxID=2026186 RepID=UPI0008FE849E|nr:hypothetical protein [Bacillus paranthracis]OJE29195.1 hypothetical protein BAQ46_04335 [Bacillus paranthracis]
MLIKFFEPQYLQMFLDGNLYFKNTGYFIDLEKKYGDKGIGDKYEGSHFRHFDPTKGEIHIGLPGGQMHKINVTKGYFTQTYEAVRQFQLTCFTGIFGEEIEHIDDNTQKIKNEVIEYLKEEFPNRIPILITNEDEFFNRLHNALKEKNIHASHGSVKYFDEHAETPFEREEYEKNMIQAFFYKRNFFKAQKEYRIITSHPVEGDSLTVNLGDISDIVLNLESADTLKNFKMRKVEEGILLTIDDE